jgi:hypothetical protein
MIVDELGYLPIDKHGAVLLLKFTPVVTGAGI